MTTKEPAWKKFLKLKNDVPVATANIADSEPNKTLKRKREPLPPPKPKKSILKKTAPTSEDLAEKNAKANKQKKKAKTKVKRSKKDEADSKSAQMAALQYLSLYCSARKEWKFSKPRQNYLIKHTYDGDIIEEDKLPNLLVYLQGLQGGSKERCLETAEGLIARFEAQQEGTNGETEVEKASYEPDAEVAEVTQEQYDRAKAVRTALTEAAPERQKSGDDDVVDDDDDAST